MSVRFSEDTVKAFARLFFDSQQLLGKHVPDEEKEELIARWSNKRLQADDYMVGIILHGPDQATLNEVISRADEYEEQASIGACEPQ